MLLIFKKPLNLPLGSVILPANRKGSFKIVKIWIFILSSIIMKSKEEKFKDV